MLRQSPPPILPSNWTGLPEELSGRVADFAGDISLAFKLRAEAGGLWSYLPVAVGLAVAGFVLIFVVSPWISRRAEMGLQRETNKSRRRLMVFGIFAIRLIVPAVGLGLLFIAPLMLDLKMQRGQGLITALPMFLTYLFVAHILGFTVFGGKGRTPGVFDIDPEQALRGYRLTLGLGFFVAIEALLVVAETAYRVSPETRAIIATFIIVIGAVPLWRLGRLLLDINAGKSAAPGTDTTGADPTEGAIVGDLIWIVARLIQIAAIVAVVASALGFVNLARQATVPMIFTLGVLAAALYFRRLLISLVRDAVGEITEDEAEGAFVLPLVVSLLIIFGVLPLLALIWGARLTDISEVWRLLTEGVKVGDMRLSLTMLITLVVVFMMGLVVTRWTQRLFRQTLLPRTKMDRGAQASLITGLGYLGLTLTGLIAISSAGIDLSSLAVVFGALSVGIGFGLRNVVSNFVSGIILLVERPVKVGDWIEVAGHSGIVKKIAVRSTRIETFDRFDVVVPNAALIEGSVKNMTLAGSDGRLVLPVGVAYGSDVDAVRTILEEAVKDDSRIISFPAPSVLFVGLGDSALDFELRVFLHDVSTVMGVKSDLLFRVYSALNKAGIEIPFPQRDVNLKGLERLAEAIETLGRRNGDAGA